MVRRTVLYGPASRNVGAALAVASALLAVGCTSTATPEATPSAAATSATSASTPAASSPTASTPASSPSASNSASVDANTLVIDIAVNGGKVDPSGRKINAQVGQQVVLNVTSDIDDEIHAHTGGDGFELEVEAGETVTGRFTLTEPGSVEVESHHLEKVIVILNAR